MNAQSAAHRPQSITELQELVRSGVRLRPRAGGTKPALSTAADGEAALDLTGLCGLVEYDPGEYTFTALAGTPVAEVNAALAAHGQALPFDPPLAAQGATLGGTVAAGLSGAGRHRYGGVRDFLIGVRFVDGRGRLVRGGGKVVKNAAGFDLPKLMVGSLGRLGVLVELSFKVFPAPAAHRTLRVPCAGAAAGLAALERAAGLPLDLEALDLDCTGPQPALLARLGGPPAALPARGARLEAARGGSWLKDEEEAATWAAAGACAWASPAALLAKVAVARPRLAALEATLAAAGAARRYSSGGALAWVAWPGAPAEFDAALAAHGLAGVALAGDWSPGLLGVRPSAPFLARIKQTLDPAGCFPAYELGAP